MKKLLEVSPEWEVTYFIPDDLWKEIEDNFDNASMFRKRLSFNQYFHSLPEEIRLQIKVSKPRKRSMKLNGLTPDKIFHDEYILEYAEEH